MTKLEFATNIKNIEFENRFNMTKAESAEQLADWYDADDLIEIYREVRALADIKKSEKRNQRFFDLITLLNLHEKITLFRLTSDFAEFHFGKDKWFTVYNNDEIIIESAWLNKRYKKDDYVQFIAIDVVNNV